MEYAKRHFGPAAGNQKRDNYFLFVSATLMLILIAGFSPTLHLKFFFDTPELWIYLYLNEAVIVK